VLAGRRPQTTRRVADLARSWGLAIGEIGWDVDPVAAAASSAGLVVSTVPANGADHLAAALSGVPVLLDVVYAPWPTALAAPRPSVSAVDRRRAVGDQRITVTGLDLLLHQALRQFELITGVAAPAAAMRAALRQAVGGSPRLPIGSPAADRATG